MATTTAPPIHHLSANYDEVSMQQSLLFSDSLNDLKNLRTQLYSAAEYFELAYTHDDQNNIVVDTLKDYAIRALVNTVDHLGSVSYKVSDLLDEKLKEVSATESRVSCIEQRLRTCKEYIDREGIAQQSSVTYEPRHHKRYVLPVGQTINGTSPTNLSCTDCGIDEDDWLQIRTAVRATVRESPSFVSRREQSASPVSRPSRLPGSFSFTSTTPKQEKAMADKRSVSPNPLPVLRSGPIASRPTTPKSSRPTTPNSALERQRKYIRDSWKSASFRVHHEEKPKPKDMERHPSKSKRLLKALLSKRKTKKDDTLDTFLDEY